MKRLAVGSVVCLALVAMCSSEVLAQGEGGGRRRGGGGGGFGRGGFTMNPALRIRFSEKLQKELNITDEQKEKVKTISEEMFSGGGGFGGGGRGGRDLSAEERQKRREEFQKKSAEAVKKIEEALKPEQIARLHGIYLQTGGLAALTDPDIAKELKLSDDTVKQIKTISDEVRKKREEIGSKMRDATGDERDKLREEMTKLGKDAEEEAHAQLSADQKAQIEKMKGEKFEFEQFGGFGGGNRGGRGGRGRGGDRNNDADKKTDEKKT